MPRTFALFFAAAFSLCLSACGGSYTVTRMQTPAPDSIRTAIISPQEGNSPEVTNYVSSALIGNGIAVAQPLGVRANRSTEADAVVTYSDVWRWDLTTYMDSISINLYNAKTGDLLVAGRWKDSFFHTWNRGDTVAQELIAEMLAKLNLKPAPTHIGTR